MGSPAFVALPSPKGRETRRYAGGLRGFLLAFPSNSPLGAVTTPPHFLPCQEPGRLVIRRGGVYG